MYPGGGLACRTGCFYGELQGIDRSRRIAMKLTEISDADVSIQVRPGIEHLLEGGKSFVVSAKLDEGIPKHSLGVGVFGV